MILEANNLNIEDDDILDSIKNKELQSKYDNIQTVLVQNHFSSKLKGAIAFFIELLIKNQIFLCYGGPHHIKMCSFFVKAT